MTCPSGEFERSAGMTMLPLSENAGFARYSFQAMVTGAGASCQMVMKGPSVGDAQMRVYANGKHVIH
jgi:hypothetical protein